MISEKIIKFNIVVRKMYLSPFSLTSQSLLLYCLLSCWLLLDTGKEGLEAENLEDTGLCWCNSPEKCSSLGQLFSWLNLQKISLCFLSQHTTCYLKIDLSPFLIHCRIAIKIFPICLFSSKMFGNLLKLIVDSKKWNNSIFKGKYSPTRRLTEYLPLAFIGE